MKLHLIALWFALAAAFALGTTGCVSGLQTQHQKIGVACADVQAAGEAIANAADAGLVTPAQAAKAAKLYHQTDKYCEPVAQQLPAADYANLFGQYKELQGTFEGLKADHPEAYAEIERRHAATGAHLDRVAKGTQGG